MYIPCFTKGCSQDRVGLTALPGFHFLAKSSVIAILLLICLPPLHKLSRRLFRPYVLFHVERGLEWVVLAQQNQRTVLTSLCSLSCFTVSISFYLAFLPLVMWGGNLRLGTRLITLMCFCEYVGNGVKDLICAPRPKGHPKGAGITKLLLSEKSGKEDAKVHSLEYGLPSSHTMHSLCLNFYLAHHCVGTGAIPEEWAFVAYTAAAVWVVWIGFSRVYMGMHTPIDIAGGAVIAIMVLSSYLEVDDWFEEWYLTNPNALVQQLMGTLLFLKLHPLPIKHTPSYENSVIFTGVLLGTTVGMRQAHGQNPFQSSFQPGTHLSETVFRLLRRLFVGGVLAGAAREASKYIAIRVLSPLYKLVPLWLRRLWKPPIHSQSSSSWLAQNGIPVNPEGTPWDVLTTSRFVSYACLAWTVLSFSFVVFRSADW